MENIQEYHGRYHVLHGLISPMNGVGPDDINLKSLITRLMDHEVQEVIVATNATADGEATSMYISRVLKPAGIKSDPFGAWISCRSRYRVCGRSDLASRD